jgi:hypothetical protein
VKALGEKSIIMYAEKSLKSLRRHLEQGQAIEKDLENLIKQCHMFRGHVDDIVEKAVRDKEEELQKLINDLDGTTEQVAANQVALSRAKTFAIFEGILAAIEDWSDGDGPAPDFAIVSKSILYPIVYEKVSKNQAPYYLTTVPPGAAEVVKRARTYIQSYRKEDKITMLDPNVFPIVQDELKDWWTRDGLGLLYNGTSKDWQREEVYTLEQMERWRTMEAARPLEFPLIFDGMELMRNYREEIREETGLPEFTRQTMLTRLKAHD